MRCKKKSFRLPIMKTNSPKSVITNTILRVIPIVATLLSANAEVEAIQIRIKAGGDQIVYSVPPGKVLILEHIIFTDYWDNQNEDKKIVIRHGGANTTGPVWNTTKSYSANWNQLMRPLRIPSGKAIAAPYLDNGSLIIFLYGKLADEGDLFAKVDTNIKGTATKVDGETKTLVGTVELASNRPSQVKLEQSSDLRNWNTLDPVNQVTTNSLAFLASSEKPRQFIRASARALPEEEILQQQLQFILPAP